MNKPAHSSTSKSDLDVVGSKNSTKKINEIDLDSVAQSLDENNVYTSRILNEGLNIQKSHTEKPIVTNTNHGCTGNNNGCNSCRKTLKGPSSRSKQTNLEGGETNLTMETGNGTDPHDYQHHYNNYASRFKSGDSPHLHHPASDLKALLIINEQQLKYILQAVTPSSGERGMKQLLFNHLFHFLRTALDDRLTLHVAGSTAYDVDTQGSDLDVVIGAPYPDARWVLQNVCRLMTSVQHEIRRIDPHNDWPLRQIQLQLVESARVPILTLRSPDGAVCDVSVNTTNSLRHTQFFKNILLERPFLRPLMRILKHWLKGRCLPQMKEGGLPTIVWMLLAVYICPVPPQSTSSTAQITASCASNKLLTEVTNGAGSRTKAFHMPPLQADDNGTKGNQRVDYLFAKALGLSHDVSLQLAPLFMSFVQFLRMLNSREMLTRSISLSEQGSCQNRDLEECKKRILSPICHGGVWDDLLSLIDSIGGPVTPSVKPVSNITTNTSSNTGSCSTNHCSATTTFGSSMNPQTSGMSVGSFPTTNTVPNCCDNNLIKKSNKSMSSLSSTATMAAGPTSNSSNNVSSHFDSSAAIDLAAKVSSATWLVYLYELKRANYYLNYYFHAILQFVDLCSKMENFKNKYNELINTDLINGNIKSIEQMDFLKCEQTAFPLSYAYYKLFYRKLFVIYRGISNGIVPIFDELNDNRYTLPASLRRAAHFRCPQTSSVQTALPALYTMGSSGSSSSGGATTNSSYTYTHATPPQPEISVNDANIHSNNQGYTNSNGNTVPLSPGGNTYAASLFCLVLLEGRLSVVKILDVCTDWDSWWSKDFLSRRDIRSVIHGRVYLPLPVPENDLASSSNLFEAKNLLKHMDNFDQYIDKNPINNNNNNYCYTNAESRILHKDHYGRFERQSDALLAMGYHQFRDDYRAVALNNSFANIRTSSKLFSDSEKTNIDEDTNSTTNEHADEFTFLIQDDCQPHLLLPTTGAEEKMIMFNPCNFISLLNVTELVFNEDDDAITSNEKDTEENMNLGDDMLDTNSNNDENEIYLFSKLSKSEQQKKLRINQKKILKKDTLREVCARYVNAGCWINSLKAEHMTSELIENHEQLGQTKQNDKNIDSSIDQRKQEIKINKGKNYAYYFLPASETARIKELIKIAKTAPYWYTNASTYSSSFKAPLQPVVRRCRHCGLLGLSSLEDVQPNNITYTPSAIKELYGLLHRYYSLHLEYSIDTDVDVLQSVASSKPNLLPNNGNSTTTTTTQSDNIDKHMFNVSSKTEINQQTVLDYKPDKKAPTVEMLIWGIICNAVNPPRGPQHVARELIPTNFIANEEVGKNTSNKNEKSTQLCNQEASPLFLREKNLSKRNRSRSVPYLTESKTKLYYLKNTIPHSLSADEEIKLVETGTSDHSPDILPCYLNKSVRSEDGVISSQTSDKNIARENHLTYLTMFPYRNLSNRGEGGALISTLDHCGSRYPASSLSSFSLLGRSIPHRTMNRYRKVPNRKREDLVLYTPGALRRQKGDDGHSQLKLDHSAIDQLSEDLGCKSSLLHHDASSGGKISFSQANKYTPKRSSATSLIREKGDNNNSLLRDVKCHNGSSSSQRTSQTRSNTKLKAVDTVDKCSTSKQINKKIEEEEDPGISSRKSSGSRTETSYSHRSGTLTPDKTFNTGKGPALILFKALNGAQSTGP